MTTPRAPRTTLDASAYKRAHGTRPRGVGRWHLTHTSGATYVFTGSLTNAPQLVPHPGAWRIEP